MGLAFWVSYTFHLENNIKTHFQPKVLKHNYSTVNACGSAILFQISNFNGSSVN
jgi:hypothetical protein